MAHEALAGKETVCFAPKHALLIRFSFGLLDFAPIEQGKAELSKPLTRMRGIFEAWLRA
ncbi:MAG: hypothetical protein KBF27_13130 [Cypionkella sp.]|nr:hypothetical protein [Cypionkella sp.]